MSRFVENATGAIEDILDNLAALQEGISAVSLLQEKFLVPFPSPLGDRIKQSKNCTGGMAR